MNYLNKIGLLFFVTLFDHSRTAFLKLGGCMFTLNNKVK